MGLRRVARDRAATGYACLAMLLCCSTAGLLKQVTNIDCAWSAAIAWAICLALYARARPASIPPASARL